MQVDMYKTTLYIRSNNDTSELEILKINKILVSNKIDCTISVVSGIWNGSFESSCIVTIINKSGSHAISGLTYKDLVSILKIELEQDSILMTQETIKAIFA